MHLKFTLRRSDSSQAHLAVTADATVTVGDLAAALSVGDPETRSQRSPANPTLKLEHAVFDAAARGRILDPRQSLIDAGLRSGATVSLGAAQAAPPPARSRRGRTAAILRVLHGPDAGREFSLTAGSSSIGRAAGCDVTLRDPSLADVHAGIVINESIEIANLAGPSGLAVAGTPVQRATLGVNDEVALGASVVAIMPTTRPGSKQTDSTAIEFNRSPRVVPRFPVREFDAPKLPQQPEPAKFPVVSMVLPLLLGVVLFAVTRSLLSVVFIALSPLLMVGMYVDTMLQNKKKYKQEIARFAESLRQLAADLEAAQRVERAVRLNETPSLDEVQQAIHRLGPLLWTHRPEHPEFLTLRLGIGDAPSRCEVKTADGDHGAEPQYQQQCIELRDQFAQVTEVPITADLRECGSLGVCGPRGVVDGIARGIVMQLIGLHSPAELTLTAFCSKESRSSWEWLEWLPHSGSPHSPLVGNHLAQGTSGGAGLLSRLEALVQNRYAAAQLDGVQAYGVLPDDDQSAFDQRPPGALPAVIVLVEDTAPIDRARLTRLLEVGPDVGVHVIWVATLVESLPAACRTFIAASDAVDGSTVGQVRRGRISLQVACDTVAVADVTQVALLLAPVADVGAAVADDSDLPAVASYLGLAGAGLADDPAVVIAQWLANDSVLDRRTPEPRPPGREANLRALVGTTGAHELHLDLREQGPHALVGGTTGSGKSEFLQTWVLGMAAAHSPDRVTFLFVDYKGGAAFADFEDLPHTVGTVTDLSPHLVQRALKSLRAEISHRERLLNRKGANSLAKLEERNDPETPPSLVIVVDEFAALVGEVPEFVDGVIDVAQRGRSLGLHLILATQRPAGVIKDNLRANTNLRIALRLADTEDSDNVVESPIAAYFPPEIRGRAAAKTGPGRLKTFQTGYVGGWTRQDDDETTIDISEFELGRRRSWHTKVAEARNNTGPTDIQRIVANIRQATRNLSIPRPRKPWLDELAKRYPLESLIGPISDGRLPIGLADNPDDQTQPVAYFDPDGKGNLAIIGTGGSGKSTALRTVAIAAALAPGNGPVHVYAFDFASAGLQMLNPLPHVSAVIDGDDDERIGRVLRRLVAEIESRARVFARANASSITEFRATTGERLPRILLLVDGFGAFRDRFEHVPGATNFRMFNQLVTDGRALGIHVVVTADQQRAIATELASFQQRAVLRLAGVDDYSAAGVPVNVLNAASPPGRSVFVEEDRLEFQIAVYGGHSSVAVQADRIGELASSMSEQNFPAPPPIEQLPEFVDLATLPASTGDGVTVGLADATLAPIGIAPRGLLLLAGPAGSGRTTALLTLAQAVRRNAPTARIVYLAPRTTPIANARVWSESIIGALHVEEKANELLFDAEVNPSAAATLTVVIDSVADFTESAAETPLAKLTKAVGDAGGFVIAESETTTWGPGGYWLLPQFKSARRGILLAPTGDDVDRTVNTDIGTVRTREFPPGRGVYVERGKPSWLQLAHPEN